MGKKKRNRNGQTVRVIRVKKNKDEPPARTQPSSSSDDREQERQSSHLFDGYGAVDLNEKDSAKNFWKKPVAETKTAVKKEQLPPIARPKGLTNLGNTCYFNSVLQVLSMTPLLHDRLSHIASDGVEWEAVHVKNLNPGVYEKRHKGSDEKEGESSSGTSSTTDPENLPVCLPPAFEIFSCFLETLRDLRTGSGQVFTPNRLLNSLGRKSWQFRGREQQDSHELLRTLMDLIRTDEIRRKRKAVLVALGINDIKNVDDDTKAAVKSYAPACNFTTIDCLFGGYILSTVRCEECDSTSQIFEQFYDLSLPISEGHPQHPHPNPVSSNSNNRSHQNNNQSNHANKREKKVTMSTSNTSAIPLPAPKQASNGERKFEDKKKSIAGTESASSAQVGGKGTQGTSGYTSVKNRKQLRAEKKAAKRAEKEERRKNDRQPQDEDNENQNEERSRTSSPFASTTITTTGTTTTTTTTVKDETPPDTFSHSTHDEDALPAFRSKDEDVMRDAGTSDSTSLLHATADPSVRDVGDAGVGVEDGDEDWDIGDLVPLLSDLCNYSDPPESGSSSRVPEPEADIRASAPPVEGQDESNLRIDMSYCMDAGQRNLDVRLQIATRDEVNVNLAINHRTCSGRKGASFECSLTSAADKESPEKQPQSSTGGKKSEDQTGSDKQMDGVSELPSDVEEEEEEDKYERLSSISGNRGDQEDEGMDDAASDGASSTRAIIDDQDLDDQLNLLSLDESSEAWAEASPPQIMTEEFTVSGDRETLPDLEPPDVADADQALFSLLLPLSQHLPPSGHHSLPDSQSLPSPGYAAHALTSAVLPPEATPAPTTRSSKTQNKSSGGGVSPSPTTDEVIRRMRSTSESASVVRRKVNWSLRTMESGAKCETRDDTPSIQSCLSVFTLPELLTGSNKLSCENCSQREAAATGVKESKVLSNASKQMLIAYPPVILTLHLKRFYAEGYGQMHLRKINRHVSFPFTLNLSPWVSQMYRRMGQTMGVDEDAPDTTLKYKLFGLVEHSGTLRSGHYTAMIRVRRKDRASGKRDKYLRLKPFVSSVDSFLDSMPDLFHNHTGNKSQESVGDEESCGANNTDNHLFSDDQKNRMATGCMDEKDMREQDKRHEDEDEEEDGDDRWFYVSDSHVAPVTRESVLNAQAYILFYERV